MLRMLRLQMVIIDLESGKRGVFIGFPLVCEETTEEDCQVESVWFTDVHEIPETATLEQLTRMAREQLDHHLAPRQ